MGVKATNFGSIIIEQHVGFRGELKFPEAFLPTKLVGDGTFGRNSTDMFGTSVSIDGQLAVVGVPSQDYDETGANSLAEAGVVFVYRRTRTSWEFAYRISAPVADRAISDNFGYSVSLKGSTLVVGSPKHALGVANSDPIVGAGAAFVFNLASDGYTFETKLLPTVLDTNDNFGSAVTSGESTVYVGSYMHGRDNNDVADLPQAGAVWAFDKTSPGVWNISKKIIAGGNERNINDQFGTAVAASSNTLVVGVPSYSYFNRGTDKVPNAGIAYVFDWTVDHWTFVSQIIAPMQEADQRFGAAVAVNGTTVVVGAPGANGTGAVYTFVRDTIEATYNFVSQVAPTKMALPVGYVQPTDVALVNGANFGSALSMNATTLVVGAPNQASLNITAINNAANPKTYSSTVIADTGFVYVYAIDAAGILTPANKFTGADRFANVTAFKEAGQFGFSVSVGANILVVGEPFANTDATGSDYKTASGIAHTYVDNGSGYVYSKTLEGFYNDRNSGDAFATAFAQNDRFMVFTAPGQDFDTNSESYMANAGAAYVWEFVGGAWVFRQKLVTTTRAVNDAFGSNVAINGTRIFVQATRADLSGFVSVWNFVDGKFVETQVITNVEITAGNNFGSVMLAQDSRVLIASTNFDVPGATDHGAVWAYTLDSASGQYALDAKLIPSSLTNANSMFGASIAMNGDVVVIGSTGQNTDGSDNLPLTASGAAFVFAKTGSVWSQVEKLTGPGDDRSATDYMGYSVSGYADMLAVGVPGANYDASLSGFADNAGKVLVYQNINNVWTLQATLTSPTRKVNGRFGVSVALGKDILAVGAPGESSVAYTTGWGHGAAYVFEKVQADWLITGKLKNTETLGSHTGPFRRFGWDVAVDSGRVIVGEPFNSTNTTNLNPLSGAGAAWTFEKNASNAWVATNKLTQDNLQGRLAGNNFGASVDIKGNLAIVGAPYDSTNTTGGTPLANAGSVSVFRRTVSQTNVVTWAAETKLAGVIQERNLNDAFGTSIAAYGDYVVIGAPAHDYDTNQSNFVNNAGALFVYKWNNGALQYIQKLTAFDGANRIGNVGFGNKVAINATHIATSSPLYTFTVGNNVNTNRTLGKVYTYKFVNGQFSNETSFQSVLDGVAGNGTANAQFGYSLSLSDSVLAIGAPYQNQDGNQANPITNAGCVEVYRFNTDRWLFDTLLETANREPNDGFGTTVSVRDNLLVIGGSATNSSIPSDIPDATNLNGGAVWVYTYDTSWNLSHKLARGNADRFVADAFGTSTAISGNTMVVGVPGHEFDEFSKVAITGAGAAYVYRMVGTDWAFEKKLVANDRAANDAFGSEVTIKDGVVFVAAKNAVVAGTKTGAVYGFRRSVNLPKTRKVRKTATFSATGASQSFVVPNNVTEVTFSMWGAAGSTDSAGLAQAGNGGFAHVVVPTTPGETLTLNVGTKPTGAGAGGGRTEILRNTSTLAVAGGGGGITTANSGGNFVGNAGSAGGLRGEDAYSGQALIIPGRGATLTNGGTLPTLDSTFYVGQGGAFKQGGNGPTDATAVVNAGGWPNGGSSTTKANVYSIAGGGDGWYGGSAGAVSKSLANLSAPAGGGSSYILPGLDGYTSTTKQEFEDKHNLLVNQSVRPGVDSSGLIVVEWFVTYETTDWNFEQKIIPTTTTNTDFGFGATLDFDGQTLVIGTSGDKKILDGSTVSYNSGSVSVYEFDSQHWVNSATLYPFGLNSNIAAYGFGASGITIDGDYIAVGAATSVYDETGDNALTGAGIVFAYHKVSGVWTNLQRLGAPGNGRNAGDLIGFAMASDGNYIAVGAPGQDYDARLGNKRTDAGAVFIWKWDGSSLSKFQKIVAPVSSRLSGGQFGYSLDFQNGELIVGAPGSSTVDGHVFTYSFSNGAWVLQQVLTLPESAPTSQLFGAELSRSGSMLAVGSPLGGTTNPGGQAIVFIKDNSGSWNFDSVVAPTGTNSSATGDAFGSAISMVDDMLLIGAPNHDYDQDGLLSLANAGATWMFQRVGNSWTQLQKIIGRGQELASGDLAGYAVAAADTILAVGAPGHDYDTNGNNYLVGAGAVYVWRWNSTNSAWVFEQKIVSPTRVASDAFGSTLAINESTLVVGAPGTTGPGKAFVFEKTPGSTSLNAWGAGTPLIASDSNAGDMFGSSVALNLETKEIIVGAPGNSYDSTGANFVTGAGAVYVFKKTSFWALDQKIVASAFSLGVTGVNGRNAGDAFGTSVGADTNTLVVGAPQRDFDNDGVQGYSDAGAVFVFTRSDSTSAYGQFEILVNESNFIDDGDNYGFAISATDSWMAVGIPNHNYDDNHDHFVSNAGAVAIWHLDAGTWTQTQLLTAGAGYQNASRKANANFGFAVKMVGSTLYVSAPDLRGTGNTAIRTGEVFEFTLTGSTWAKTDKIIDPDFTLSRQFGFSLDYDGTTLIVGSPQTTSVAGNSLNGRVHFFAKTNNVMTLVNSVGAVGGPSVGSSVSVNGSVAVVGVPNDFGNRGSAVIYAPVNGVWTFVERIVSQKASRQTGDNFGYSIATDGDTMVVGIPYSDFGSTNRPSIPGITSVGDATSNTGAVVIYQIDSNGTYVFKQRISAHGTNSSKSDDHFGWSVSIQGDTIVVSAPNHGYDEIGANFVSQAGAVFVYARNENGDWMQTNKLVAQGYMPRTTNANFGYDIAFNDNILAVGTPGANSGKSAAAALLDNAGAVYVYRLVDGVWFFVDKAIGDNAHTRLANQQMGKQITLGNSILASTLPGNTTDENGFDSISNAGAVIIHKMDSLGTMQVKLLGAPYTTAAQVVVKTNSSGFYDGVNITNHGTGYTGTPDVLFSNPDFEGYALMAPTSLSKIIIDNFNPDAADATVSIVNDPLDTTGGGATAIINRSDPKVGSIVITDPGAGYLTAPTVTVSNSTGVQLVAILQKTQVQSLNLLSSTGGFTAVPQVTIAAPDEIGGSAATAHATIKLNTISLHTTDDSYVGEKLTLAVNGTSPVIQVSSVDASGNISAISIITPGDFTNATYTSVNAFRIIDNEVFGSVNDSTGAVAPEDYGLVTEAVTSSEDYGLITDPVTSSVDYQASSGSVNYASITEAVTSTISYGSISETSATFDMSFFVDSLILDYAGSGYRNVPAVSIQSIGTGTATASANVNSVGVDYVNVVNPGSVAVNSTVSFSGGTGITPAQGTLNTAPGTITDITLTANGSNYTRTPKVVFNNSTFSARAQLAPTTVASVVTTKQDSTLTVQGTVKYQTKIVEPASLYRPNQKFGSAIDGYGSTVVVGAPMSAAGSDNGITAYNSGQVLSFESTIEDSDRFNKIAVSDWVDVSSVINDITGDFSMSLWIKTNALQRAKNLGGIFAARNSILATRSNAFSQVRLHDDGPYTVPQNVTKLQFSAWGAGNDYNSNKFSNSGYAQGIINVTPGDVIGSTIGKTASGTGRTVVTINGTPLATVGSGQNRYAGPRGDIGALDNEKIAYDVDPSTYVATGPGPWRFNKFGDVQNAGMPGSAASGNAQSVWFNATGCGSVYNPNGVANSIAMSADKTFMYVDRGDYMDAAGVSYPGIHHERKTNVLTPTSMTCRSMDIFTNNTNQTVTFTATIRVPRTNNTLVLDSNFGILKEVGATYSFRYSVDNHYDSYKYVGIVIGDGWETSDVGKYVGQVGNYNVNTIDVVLGPGQRKVYCTFVSTQFRETSSLTGAVITTSVGNRSGVYTAFYKKRGGGVNSSFFNNMSDADIRDCSNFDIQGRSDQYATTVDVTKVDTQFNGGPLAYVFDTKWDAGKGQGSKSGAGQDGFVAIYPIVTENANQHMISVNNDGMIKMAGDQQYKIAGFVDNSSDSWNNISYTVSGSTAKLYWNGELLGTTSIDSDFANIDAFTLGALYLENELYSTPARDKFNGYMSDIAFWKTGLTQSQVQNVIDNGAASVSPTNLIALWAKN